ncbi:ABC transporter permease subunit [Nonomuraea sp. SYSU D8015]|uniref:ABC transporter permease subunit n=1 Tax=Nonomuraea sp. SYSU D8015 TaxID=2593644 RepID=UPI00166036E8|nr:ABC transporter permease subunit [Nonomuraea sp. SYSU D8015]
MTAATLSVPGVSLSRAIHAEWIKLRSVRSTTVALLLSVIVLIGVGLIAASSMAEPLATGTLETDGPPFQPTTATGATLGGVPFAQLLIGALGVLYVSVEYSTGMIRATFSAVPRRLPVLWAKCIVFAGVVFALMLVSTLVAFFAGSAFLAAYDIAPSLSDPGVLRAVVAAPVYLTGVGVMAIALAALMRSTALAVSVVSFVVFLLDSLVGMLLPGEIADVITPYLPSTAGKAFMSEVQVDGVLSPLPGFLVFCAYLVVLVGFAAYALHRRDA